MLSFFKVFKILYIDYIVLTYIIYIMHFISQIATKVALFQGPAQLSHYGKATEGPSGIIYHVT